MKKRLHLLFSFFLLCMGLIAQNVLAPGIQNKGERKSIRGKSSVISANTNSPKEDCAWNNLTRNLTDGYMPEKLLDSMVDIWKNIDTGERCYYKTSYERYTEDWGNYIRTVTINKLDNDLEETDQTFTLQLPHYTGDFKILTDFKSSYIMCWIHYFEGQVGPDYMKDEIWIVGHDGTIINKYDATSIGDIFEGKMIYFYTNKGTGKSEIKILNANTLTEEKSIELADIQYMFGLGELSASIRTIAGKSYIIVPHCSDIFYNQDEMTYNLSNNYLVLDFYDIETYTKKEIKLLLENFVSLDKLGPYQVGMITVEFDMFPHYEWGVSDKRFNDDDKIEFVIGVSYESFDSEVTNQKNYYVINEDGVILSSLERYLSISIDHVYVMNDIEGEDDLIVFGEYIDGGNMQLLVFNINTWSPVLEIPAVDNGLQFMAIVQRQKEDGKIYYMIPSGTITGDVSQPYGNIAKYASDNTLAKVIKLKLEENGNYFMPYLNDYIIKPGAIFNDTEIYYPYISRNTGEQGDIFLISRENTDPAFVWKSSDEFGQYVGEGPLMGLDMQEANWLFFMHQTGTYPEYQYNYAYFKLPMTAPIVSIDKNIADTNITIGYDKTSQTVNITDDTIKNVTIYSANGIAIYSGNSQNVSTSGWNRGLYIVKVITDNGSNSYEKLLIY